MKFIPAALALACLSLTACMGYTLKPERPASMPKAEAPPLPLKVGMVVEEGKDGGLGSRFAEALAGARLFSEVRRGAQTGVDLVIQGRFSSDFIQDPMQAPKIIFVVFTGLITGAVMSETSHHTAQGSLSVAYPEGKVIKTYDENVDVVAKSMVSAFAEQKTMKLGPPAAMDNLVAKLVQGLIDDRPLFEHLQSPAKSAPQRPAPEAAPPVAEAEAPQAKPETQPVADAEPAPQPQIVSAPEPAPAKRGPLTPAEEREIDEQLMP